jgi:hypothetical protein
MLHPGIDGYDRAGFVSELFPVYHGNAVRWRAYFYIKYNFHTLKERPEELQI